MADIEHSLGDFDLSLAEDGKLRSLVYGGWHELLSRADYGIALGDGRTFTAEGWDECFPTIEPFAESCLMGDLAGWAPVVAQSWHSLVQVWERGRYTARREFRRHGDDGIEVRFVAASTSGEPMEFLWASHALFTLDGLMEVELPDGTIIDDFTLDGSNAKRFTHAGAVLMRHWDFTVVLLSNQPFWGVWLNRGGWPPEAPAGFGCIGVMATNTDADHPRGASIEPGGEFAGVVTLTIRREYREIGGLEMVQEEDALEVTLDETV